MNRNLENAIAEIEKADAMMKAYESAYLNREELDYCDECRAVAMFYAVWDTIKRGNELLEFLKGDEKVVDVILALNQSRE